MRRVLGALALLAACGACGAGPTDTSAGPSAPAVPSAYGVDELTLTFVDRTRPTTVPDGSGSEPTRRLVTTVRHPRGAGPFPLVILAHGFDGHPRKFVELSTAWARAGYVVAVPAFPLTNDEVAETIVGDYRNQPADVSFVIDEVLALSAAPDGPLVGLVDPQRIGIAGLSVGGAAVFGTGFHTCCRDQRVDAVVVMAGALFPFDGIYELTGAPLLLLHGDADPSVPYSGAVDAYARALPPKYFVTILGGGHSPPFEDTDDPADEMVTAVTVDFWDAYLKQRPGAADELLAEAAVTGLTTVRSDTG